MPAVVIAVAVQVSVLAPKAATEEVYETEPTAAGPEILTPVLVNPLVTEARSSYDNVKVVDVASHARSLSAGVLRLFTEGAR